MTTPLNMNFGTTPARNAGTAALALLACLLAAPAQAGTRPVDEHVAADAAGTVEITDVAGTVDLQGWDKPEVSVTGTIGDHVDRIEVTGGGSHVSVKVIEKKGNGSWNDEGTRLVVKVPARSALDVNLVSADLKLGGISGPAHLQTVSGEITGETAGDVSASTVSGDVKLVARSAHDGRFKTVSGELTVEGPSGDLEVGSVSGDAHVKLGSLTRLHAETVSGDLHVKATLAPNGQVDASSVSGDVQLEFAGVPDADFDVSAFSGDVTSCFGPKPQHQEFGPGTHLNFRNGKGGGRVHVNTQSGDVSICTAKP
jgi:DUF4097 and DUF4098 domain-containing protein YvlB